MPEYTNYESLRAELDLLPPPDRAFERRTLWIVERTLGIAKTSAGAIELFLVGQKLTARTNLVKRHLEYGQWQASNGEQLIDANRLVLPAEPQFLPIAALISVEILRYGPVSPQSLQTTFNAVEPIVELALQRVSLTEEHIVGLLGELILLEAMIDALNGKFELMSSVLDMWRGHLVGLRDFLIGDVAIEVKTTQLLGSSHQFSGLHQIEISGESGALENTLYMFSVGLAPTSGDGYSLSETVQRITAKMCARQNGNPAPLTILQSRFLSEVANYGNSSSLPYNHLTMSNLKPYSVRFGATFAPRLYEMIDPEVRVIRSADLEGTYVSRESLSFRLELPSQITATNPELNWQQFISFLVRTKLGLSN